MFYLIARGRIGIPDTPKTELPMAETAETLDSPLVTAVQNSPTIILLDSGQQGFPGHLYALLTVVVKFPVF